MDNPNQNDINKDDTSKAQEDILNAEETSPAQQIREPDDIREPMDPEPVENPEDPAEEATQIDSAMEPKEPADPLPDESDDPSDDPAWEASKIDSAMDPGELSDPLNEEADDPSDEPAGDPARELSPDEVRTALVKVRGQNRSSHFNAGEHTLKPGEEVVVQTEQGKAIGVVMEPPVLLECRGCKNLTILRKATPEEISRDEENRELEKKAFEYCVKTIEEWEIPMRLVQVEFHLDRTKAVFYFTAEKRVDFRELVRTLAREFSTRIEMKQIGIRDEARLLGGIGPCGMGFCCSTFLKEFAPISVKMAKEQNVILNPNKISGGCGRLLCCLNYEYDQYKEASRGVPKIGKKINLPEGTGKVRSVDIFSRTVTIDMTDDKPLVIDIDELREKMK